MLAHCPSVYNTVQKVYTEYFQKESKKISILVTYTWLLKHSDKQMFKYTKTDIQNHNQHLVSVSIHFSISTQLKFNIAICYNIHKSCIRTAKLQKRKFRL